MIGPIPGTPARPSLPEAIEPVAVNGATRGDGGIGAVEAPVHATALPSAQDHGPAGLPRRTHVETHRFRFWSRG